MAREGSRWINERPTGEEVADWFKENVPLHDGLDPTDFVTGVTLISAKEKVAYAAENSAGEMVILEREQLVHVPYAKVETRIAYFWKLMEQHPEWLGVIEPERVEKLNTQGYHNAHLPAGFFMMPVQRPDAKFVHFIGCSMRVSIFKRDTVRSYSYGVDGELVTKPAAGTKIVNVNGRSYEDPNSLMKAETGAIGRALGMAGMLVLPGSGVATAEDMQEALAGGGGAMHASLPPEPAAGEPDQPVDQKTRAEQLLGILESEYPAKLEEVQAWARDRRLNLDDIGDDQLRGVVRQLERRLAEAQAESGSE